MANFSWKFWKAFQPTYWPGFYFFCLNRAQGKSFNSMKWDKVARAEHRQLAEDSKNDRQRVHTRTNIPMQLIQQGSSDESIKVMLISASIVYCSQIPTCHNAILWLLSPSEAKNSFYSGFIKQHKTHKSAVFFHWAAILVNMTVCS